METDRDQIITYFRISDGTHADLSFTGNFLLLPSENVHLPFSFVSYSPSHGFSFWRHCCKPPNTLSSCTNL